MRFFTPLRSVQNDIPAELNSYAFQRDMVPSFVAYVDKETVRFHMPTCRVSLAQLPQFEPEKTFFGGFLPC